MRSTAQLTSSPHPHQPSQLPGVRGGHSYTLQRETREGLTRTPLGRPFDPFRGGRPAAARPTGGGRAVPWDFSHARRVNQSSR